MISERAERLLAVGAREELRRALPPLPPRLLEGVRDRGRRLRGRARAGVGGGEAGEHPAEGLALGDRVLDRAEGVLEPASVLGEPREGAAERGLECLRRVPHALRRDAERVERGSGGRPRAAVERREAGQRALQVGGEPARPRDRERRRRPARDERGHLAEPLGQGRDRLRAEVGGERAAGLRAPGGHGL